MCLKKPDNRARVLIVDDHHAVREALALWIGRQPDLKVCGEAADMNEALRLIADTEPDVAVVDISLRTGNGIDLIQQIKARHDHIRILAWSMHSDSLYAERALCGGALGYIIKDQAMDRIVEAIRRVLAGKVWLSQEMTKRMLQQTVGTASGDTIRSPLRALADCELEVFRMLGEGVTTAEIAERLRLSVKTVETYRDQIRRKLNLADGTKLALYATLWVLENGSAGKHRDLVQMPEPLQVGARIRLTSKYKGRQYHAGDAGTIVAVVSAGFPLGTAVYQVRLDEGTAALYPAFYEEELERH
jgi:DNA-binding NarL/FixJ family response regulator